MDRAIEKTYFKISKLYLKLAETEGFEPSIRL